MNRPDSQANSRAGACQPSLLAPLPEWRLELRQRLETYRARRPPAAAAPPSTPWPEPEPPRILSFPAPVPARRMLVQAQGLALAWAEPVADPVAPSTPAPEPDPLPAVVPPRRRAPAPDPDAPAFLQIPLPLAESGAEPAAAPAYPVAGRARRFQAGLLDVLIVGLGSGLFALAGWASQGFAPPDAHSLRHLLPALVAVPGSLAALYLLACFYCGAATWGMACAGLELRACAGPLTPALRRRRGWACLVSLAALGLGFLWMFCDSQRLTWHDYISATFIAEAGAGSASPDVLPTPGS